MSNGKNKKPMDFHFPPYSGFAAKRLFYFDQWLVFHDKV